MGVDAAVCFSGMGITAVKKGEAEKIQIGSFPTFYRIIDQSVAAGVELYVCEASTKLIDRLKAQTVFMDNE